MNGAETKIAEARRWALRTGIAGFIVCIIGMVIDPQQFFRSYLFGYLFWFGIAVGCLGILLIHDLVGGQWGDLVKPMLEAGSATLPVLALLFIPVGLGAKSLYPWSHPEVLRAYPVLAHKHMFLNIPFFWGRALVYFILLYALVLRRSAVSFIIYYLVLTFAS